MKNKISFCTTSMNRLDHLKKTLATNIQHNIDYGNIEFIVLNYNSQDSIDKWIYEEMFHYIEQGVLRYYSTTEPLYFDRSHSRNLSMRCATGNILCNLDADNFTGYNFASYVNDMFVKHNNIFLAVERQTGLSDLYGRICFKSEDFLKVTGYDENMKGYGFEDIDLQARLKNLGREIDSGFQTRPASLVQQR